MMFIVIQKINMNYLLVHSHQNGNESMRKTIRRNNWLWFVFFFFSSSRGANLTHVVVLKPLQNGISNSSSAVVTYQKSEKNTEVQVNFLRAIECILFLFFYVENLFIRNWRCLHHDIPWIWSTIFITYCKFIKDLKKTNCYLFEYLDRLDSFHCYGKSMYCFSILSLVQQQTKIWIISC